MTTPTTHVMHHNTTVQAPPEQVFELIASAEDWPRIFRPSLHVEYLDRSGGDERLRIWATANDEVKCWTSRRTVDRERFVVCFSQEVSQAPVHRMAGEWRLEAADEGGTTVHLAHEFQALDDAPDSVAWIRRAVDANSGAELAALAAAADPAAGELLISFDDIVRIAAPPAQVHDFILRADRWAERIPHVASAVLEEPSPEVQLLQMETRTRDGSSHTTRSVRICLPDRIVYKQLQLPRLMTAHTGCWRFDADRAGTAVTSTHTVVIDRTAVAAVLGPEATVEQARDFVRNALSANSTATIRRAEQFLAEGAAVPT